MKEPALWPIKKGDDTFRITVLPTFQPGYSARFDRLQDHTRVTFTRLTGAGGYEPGDIWVKDIYYTRDPGLHRTFQYIDKTSLKDGKKFGFDGTHYIFERSDGVKYRIFETIEPDGELGTVFKKLETVEPRLSGKSWIERVWQKISELAR